MGVSKIHAQKELVRLNDLSMGMESVWFPKGTVMFIALTSKKQNVFR